MKRSAKAFEVGVRRGQQMQDMLKKAASSEVRYPPRVRGAWSLYAEQGLRDAAMQPGLSPERKVELEAAAEKIAARYRKR